MNKPDLINEVAEKTGMKKVDVEKAINATLDAITEALSKKEEVSLVGFGTFGV
ncbi:MAG: HU family DNA-binding protein, partial [Armatimonadota bacterium]|nr:HU family DNA-binding protein [Armatimonadota bacterium]